MPEMQFTIRWPDGNESACYSPSLVIEEHLAVGQSYPLDDFVRRSTEALGIASERVRARFGYACSRALGQIDSIRERAGTQGGAPDAAVAVLRFTRL